MDPRMKKGLQDFACYVGEEFKGIHDAILGLQADSKRLFEAKVEHGKRLEDLEGVEEKEAICRRQWEQDFDARLTALETGFTGKGKGGSVEEWASSIEESIDGVDGAITKLKEDFDARITALENTVAEQGEWFKTHSERGNAFAHSIRNLENLTGALWKGKRCEDCADWESKRCQQKIPCAFWKPKGGKVVPNIPEPPSPPEPRMPSWDELDQLKLYPDREDQRAELVGLIRNLSVRGLLVPALEKELEKASEQMSHYACGLVARCMLYTLCAIQAKLVAKSKS